MEYNISTDKEKFFQALKQLEEQNKRIREDTECNCLWYVQDNYPDTFKEEYPAGEINQYYTDQSPNLGLYVSSVYTSFGIKQIDSWFCYQITQEKKFSKKELEKMIRVNPHLHNVIKTNLIENLKNYIR